MEPRAAAQDGRFEDEGWRMRKEGSRFSENVILTALRDTDGKPRRFGNVTRDLTERRLSEEGIKKQAQEIFEMAVVPVVPGREGIGLCH